MDNDQYRGVLTALLVWSVRGYRVGLGIVEHKEEIVRAAKEVADEIINQVKPHG